MIIDRSDNVMNLCEMKYSKGEYVITRKYREEIQNRMRTKKALRCTFITTHGVKDNDNSDIVDNHVEAEDLFV
ncbi:MAG: hypothetical protein J6P05_05795 [Lachnospiraceae bacterium]|nr:hypothetical protein [Lachnospiraceae bacterium]